MYLCGLMWSKKKVKTNSGEQLVRFKLVVTVEHWSSISYPGYLCGAETVVQVENYFVKHLQWGACQHSLWQHSLVPVLCVWKHFDKCLLQFHLLPLHPGQLQLLPVTHTDGGSQKTVHQEFYRYPWWWWWLSMTREASWRRRMARKFWSELPLAACSPSPILMQMPKPFPDAILNSVNCISHIQQGNFFWEENFNFPGGEKKISSCLDHEQVRSEKWPNLVQFSSPSVSLMWKIGRSPSCARMSEPPLAGKTSTD